MTGRESPLDANDLVQRLARGELDVDSAMRELVERVVEAACLPAPERAALSTLLTHLVEQDPYLRSLAAAIDEELDVRQSTTMSLHLTGATHRRPS